MTSNLRPAILKARTARRTGEDLVQVKEAVAAAKAYVKDVFAEESISNLGLEEVEFEPGAESWRITVGFSRPWNSPRTRAQQVMEAIQGEQITPQRRVQKVVIISDRDGSVLSVKNREASG